MPLDPVVPQDRSAGPLPPEERRRAARHLLLEGFGRAAQERLAAARVLVVGAGGLGSPVLQYLAAAGVGTLGVVDDDVVELSNLQRQVLHGEDTVGSPKTASAARALRRLAPEVEVVEHRERLDASNARRVLAGYDVVVDGCDTFATRYAVSDAASALGLPVVWGTVLGWDGQVAVWWSAAPDGRSITYPDVFGPQPAAEGESCATVGVLSPACGVVGATLAVEAVKLLTGTGEPALGRLLSYDARTSTWEEVPLAAVGGPSVEEAGAAASRSPSRSRARGASGGAGEGSEGPLVVDVSLVAGGGPEGSVWVRLEDLAGGEYPPELAAHPKDAPVVVVCPYGLRSRGAATLLAGDGWTAVESRPLRPGVADRSPDA
ncbi:HesA/MoeB/ThiF family protein [Isoptericola sp. S6320L]|uniref:HesA/MoeB/ThiF family protein n=1 Tax=Isoptericola sp. S6320L TaxID=2926411 RepID=UPI001FF5CC28|nr:HesA/MoeB/ThiF family protein [Isoptericola sp. S6320L]MCK0116205.1 HesA/MoeB/ThiF family protein [Isoptericola sp. S6320L]